MRLKHTWAVVVPAILAITLLTQVSFAIPVTGNLKFGGAVDVELDGLVTTMDFLPEDTGTGDFEVLGNSTPEFDTLIGTTGTIMDINDTDHPTDTPLNVQFLTFDANPDIIFNLTGILPATSVAPNACLDAPAAGQVCIPGSPSGGASPFQLVNITAGSSLISFTVTADAIRVSTGEVTPYTGTFTATFDRMNFQTVLAQFFNEGEVNTAYDADFNPGFIIPEPSTMNLLIGALFVGVGALSRKKFLGRK